MAQAVVIIPSYNEKENIEKIIRKVFSLDDNFHILVVDDGSPDGTAQIVKNLTAEFPGRLFLEGRKGKLGLGTAYIHGFKWALGKNYDFIFEMDADFSHNPDDLPRLLNACKNGADVAVGSRYTGGGNVENWPLNRKMLSQFASLYVRMILWMPVMDPTAGFKCYKKEVLSKLNLDAIRFIGYAFQIEMKYRAYRAGFRVVEVPITFIDRKEGVSKMSMSIFKEAFWGVIRMRLGKN
ncbi:MAG: polyprenol monophosphomannose synthase [Bacteroidetes bacterium]|nr:polyprenol monophosphomannose synthase [Bacteroidota bacterium]